MLDDLLKSLHAIGDIIHYLNILHFFEDIAQYPAKNPGVVDDKDFDWKRWRSYFCRLVSQGLLPL